MSKELIVSANRHETRVAVLEDDQVVEVYYQREKEYSLAGSIHKGRVTRVLPGMQSAFVDIGLDRDAFLYVSDFFEDNDEYDKIVTSVEEKILKMEKGPGPGGTPPPPLDAPPPAELPAPELSAEAPAAPAVAAQPAPAPLAAPDQFARRNDERDRDRRGGRRGRRPRPKGPGLPESKYFPPGPHTAPVPPPAPEEAVEAEPETPEDTAEDIVVLPGESLAKYRGEAGGTGVPACPPDPPEPTADLPPAPEAAEPPEAAAPEPAEAAVAAEFAETTEAPEIAEPAEAPESAEPAEAQPAEAEPTDEDQLGPEPARIPTSLTATLREQGGRYTHRVSRRMPRSGRPDGDPQQRSDPQQVGLPPAVRKLEPRPDDRPDVRQVARPEAARADKPAAPSISDLLREGQEIIVQIAKEPLGQKGARITSHIALPGRFLVYMPTVDHIGVSRKIPSDEERLRCGRRSACR